jgi:GNAT superfamily N-acetyltransferase
LLGVAWSYQQQGLGKKIIDFFKECHINAKFIKIVAFADQNAVGFFKKQGFVPLSP